MAAALVGALISGVGMYAIGTHAQDRVATTPAAVPGYVVPASQPQPVATSYVQPVVAPPAFVQPIVAPQAFVQPTVAPQPVIYRDVAPARIAPAAPRVVERRHRSVAKTALVIGGSTAGAAGLGGLLGGKKGALVGAALGGGAASIYEAFRR